MKTPCLFKGVGGFRSRNEAQKMNNKFSRIQLHPELQPYLDRNEGTIEHPIYRCEFAHPAFYHRINLVYESKKHNIDIDK